MFYMGKKARKTLKENPLSKPYVFEMQGKSKGIIPYRNAYIIYLLLISRASTSYHLYFSIN